MSPPDVPGYGLHFVIVQKLAWAEGLLFKDGRVQGLAVSGPDGGRGRLHALVAAAVLFCGVLLSPPCPSCERLRLRLR